MLSTLKDIISFLVYITICPFIRNKKAVLLYHSVDYIAKDKDPNKNNVDPVLFDKHMALIKKNKERFVITFDDGYESVYINAIPIIKKYGIRTVLFLTTDYIDGKIKLDRFFLNKYSPSPLAWEQVKEIRSLGAELGCHSLTHRNMADLDEKAAYLESFASRKRILDMTGYNVSSFSYPFGNRGSFNEKTEKILSAMGYEKAYTNMMGMDNSEVKPFAIRRIRIYSTDNMLRFKMKIAGAYNWVDLFVTGGRGSRFY